MMQFADLRRWQSLGLARGPVNDRFIDLGALAEAEMESALVLSAETRSAGDFLYLLLAVPVEGHPRPDGAAIAAGSLQIELDPVVGGCDRVFVEQQRPLL